jgi:hypothetical protein
MKSEPILSGTRQIFQIYKFCLMPGAGVEPARLTAIDLKSIVYANFTTRAYILIQQLSYFLILTKARAGIEPAHGSFADFSVSTSPPCRYVQS